MSPYPAPAPVTDATDTAAPTSSDFERRLDEALDESFLASDPVATHPPEGFR